MSHMSHMSHMSRWSQSPSRLDQRGRARVLKRILARHAQAVRDGRGYSSSLHLVYVGDDGDPMVYDMPLDMSRWLSSARGDIDDQLQELTAAFSSEQIVRKLAETVEIGFIGVILSMNAGYLQQEACNLINVRQEMVVASLVTLDERATSARYLLDDNAIEFSEDHEEHDAPWDIGSLKQLLFTLDDALRMHEQQQEDKQQSAFVVPVVLVVEPPLRVPLPGQAQQAPSGPRVNL